ncbi:thiamine-binding protein [Vibrio lentus]|nr:thiamine-binding protein [Vibrio lentus]
MVAFQDRVKKATIFVLVDKVTEVVKAADVLFQIGAMETTMKGELNQLLEIVKKAFDAFIHSRWGLFKVITTNIKIHSETDRG